MRKQRRRSAAQLISAFVFTRWIVQFLLYLHPKFQASSLFLWLYSPVCVGPGGKPRRPVFSQRGSFVVLFYMFLVCFLFFFFFFFRRYIQFVWISMVHITHSCWTKNDTLMDCEINRLTYRLLIGDNYIQYVCQLFAWPGFNTKHGCRITYREKDNAWQ